MLYINCNSPVSRRNKYCSNKCQQQFQYKEYISRWKQGLETGMRGDYQVSMHIKSYLFSKFNGKCSKCNWGEKKHI